MYVLFIVGEQMHVDHVLRDNARNLYRWNCWGSSHLPGRSQFLFMQFFFSFKLTEITLFFSFKFTEIT